MMLQILTFLISVFHPYFVSVSELKHNPQSQAVEISCRIFSDDLELALKKLSPERVDVLQPKNKAQNDLLIAKYIPQHLKISINGKPVTLKYIGYELESEATWCYFEIPNIRSVKRIQIQNDLLFAEHEEQINMMHVTVNGSRKSTKLDNPKSRAEFSF